MNNQDIPWLLEFRTNWKALSLTFNSDPGNGRDAQWHVRCADVQYVNMWCTPVEDNVAGATIIELYVKYAVDPALKVRIPGGTAENEDILRQFTSTVFGATGFVRAKMPWPKTHPQNTEA